LIVKKSDTIVAEVHEIRRQIYERTKDMTASERTAYFNESGRRSAEKYGFKIYRNAEEAEMGRAL
jgi:hypothetical protein